jgi:hypothetical protein
LAVRATGVVVVVLVIKAVSITGDWSRRLTADTLAWSSLSLKLNRLSSTPSRTFEALDRRVAGIVEYVHDCTREDDRVLAAWFFPELYFLADRGFAAGLVVVFGSHWSEPRWQQRSADALAAQRAPIVIFQGREFPGDYGLLDAYLREHYHVDGVTGFGNPDVPPDHYTVLVRNDARASRRDDRWGLSCFD